MDKREEFRKFKAIMPEIHKKLDRVEILAGSCDPRMIDEMTDINAFLKANIQFRTSREYRMIATDANIIKTDIVDHCICPRRI